MRRAVQSLLHQLVYSPTHVQTTQIAIVLTHAQEDNGYAGGVNHTNEGTNHVANSITFGDDKAIKPTAFALSIHELRGEVTSLGNRVCAYKSLATVSYTHLTLPTKRIV